MKNGRKGVSKNPGLTLYVINDETATGKRWESGHHPSISFLEAPPLGTTKVQITQPPQNLPNTPNISKRYG
jgi:hypothetical protein